MKHLSIIFGVLVLSGWTAVMRAEEPGDQVVVIYNTRVPESKDVAEHYAQMRHVPPGQVLGFDLPATDDISRVDYQFRLQKPLLKALEKKHLMHFDKGVVASTDGQPRLVNKVTESKIRYAVLCYGVPLRIGEDKNLREDASLAMQPELRKNEAALDSELACLPIPPDQMIITGPRLNAFYGCTNAALFHPTNGVLMVARLDGPTAAIARNLVDKAMAAEADGLWGRAYFDLRGLTNGPYKMADDSMRSGSETCRRIGFETVVDYNGATLPANFPLSQVALYAGWYDVNVSGPFARPTVEFMPGAFAYHLHSFSAFTLRSTTRGWTGPLLAKGATATMGCVAEPYLIGTPDMGNFFLRFISGDSFGEAAYASQRFVSWETTVVGDPLYRPFGKAPRQQHEDLEQKHSKLIEWSYLRLTNYKLLNGTPRKEMIEQLESLQIARESAVLTEKLADLYSLEGNAAASVTNLQESLKLGPTPQQRVRIMLALADRLITLQRNEDAYLVYQQFLKEVPDYADELFIYRRLLDLAQKLGKKDDADKFEHQVSHLAAPSQPPKGPPIRHGI